MKMWEMMWLAAGIGLMSLVIVSCAVVADRAEMGYGRESGLVPAWKFGLWSGMITFWVVWGCLCWMDHAAR